MHDLLAVYGKLFLQSFTETLPLVSRATYSYTKGTSGKTQTAPKWVPTKAQGSNPENRQEKVLSVLAYGPRHAGVEV
jgi:hypothetical protein